MTSINGIQPPTRPISPFEQATRAGSSKKLASGVDEVAGLLADQVQQVNTMQSDANSMVHSLLTGGDVNEAEVLTAVQKADLAFRMMMQARNKLVQVYQEIQNIQI